MRTLILATLLSGCISSTAVPAAMHPTASASEQSVGVSVGGGYQKTEGASLLTIPYGEGWIRHPVGTGQIGINVAPSMVRFGYRFDAKPLADGVGLAIEPMVGFSYFRTVDEATDPADPDDKESALILTAGVVPTVLFPAGSSFAYVSPKLGFQHVRTLAGSMAQDDTTNSYVLGASVGIGISAYVSLELAIHRIDDLEDEPTGQPDQGAAWLIVPTVGVRH